MEKIKKNLGFGFMRLPMQGEEVDLAQTRQMVDAFLAAGFNYFDTAHGYLDGRSETALKACLTSRYPREDYVLTNKLTANFFKTEADIRPFFESQLAACGVDDFDFYLMHAQSMKNFEHFKACRAYETAFALKAEGKVRHVGISFHDSAEMLDRILTEYPQLEAVQLQFNYVDYDDPAVQSRRCYEVCRKHGKPVIVMEPVKGGMLANRIPESVEAAFKAYDPDLSVPSWAIRYAAGHDNVAVVLSGMSSMEQLLDNTGYMENFKPLDEKEQELIRQAVTKINEGIEIQCTGCSYCTAGCPMNIPIPEYFALYNADQNETRTDWTTQREFYSRTALNSGKVGDCIGCGQCEAICPQHLPITRFLEEIHAASTAE